LFPPWEKIPFFLGHLALEIIERFIFSFMKWKIDVRKLNFKPFNWKGKILTSWSLFVLKMLC
jgi:hypothetical protein